MSIEPSRIVRTSGPAAAVLALVISSLSVRPDVAAAQPASDIFLFPVTWPSDTVLTVGVPENVTHRRGYDNQPSFLPNSAGFLYASIDSTGQADVWLYELATKQSKRLTMTPESEFSPTVIPGDSAFSCVRVEADSSQRLWRFPMAGGAPTVILPDVKPVGYHLWAATSTLALFVLGQPNTLELVHSITGERHHLADNPGRSIHRIPSRNAISYIDKSKENEWWIMRVDMAALQSYPIIPTLPGSEDMIWIGPNALLMSEKNRLVRWVAKDGHLHNWSEVAAFEEAGLQSITRMALSPDRQWLAVVSAEAGP